MRLSAKCISAINTPQNIRIKAIHPQQFSCFKAKIPYKNRLFCFFTCQYRNLELYMAQHRISVAQRHIMKENVMAAKKSVTKTATKPAAKKAAPKAAAKAPVKKAAVKAPAKTAAKAAAPAKKPAAKTAAITERFNKTQILTEIAEATELNKKQVQAVLDELSSVIERHIKKRAVGEFVLPGLLKINTISKPARKARKGINPFTGEETTFAAKPASTSVKVRALKKLKEMVA
jgi:nucleoid DNA-binding protein